MSYEDEFYEKWKQGKVKAICEYCGKEFGFGEGDLFDEGLGIEEWICYECLDKLEQEEEDERLYYEWLLENGDP